MRSLKVLGILLCAVVIGSIAMAGQNDLGIHDSAQVTFIAPIRVGTTLLPPGDYVVKHLMEGQEHMMVFQSVRGKTPEVKVKCLLVQLGNKADQTRTVYALNAAHERVLQELVFRGDTAKHVF